MKWGFIPEITRPFSFSQLFSSVLFCLSLLVQEHAGPGVIADVSRFLLSLRQRQREKARGWERERESEVRADKWSRVTHLKV